MSTKSSWGETPSARTEDGVGVVAFTNGAHQPDLWLPAEVFSLMGRLLDLPATGPGPPQCPEVWDDITGWYRLLAGFGDVRLRGFIGAGAEVFGCRGRPMLRFLSPIPALFRGFPLQPDDEQDPYAFRIALSESGPEAMRVVFGQGPDGRTDRLHLDLIPLTMPKESAWRNPKRWALGGAAVATAGFLSSRRCAR